MRIVQAAGWYFPNRTGGTEIYVAALSRRLRAKGHEVEVVAPEPGGHRPHSYLHDGIRVHRYPTPAELTRDQAQGMTVVDSNDWFSQWIGTIRPHVVHFHTLVPGLEIPEVRAARSTGARVVATTHASSLGHICARGTLMQWGESVCDGVAGITKCAACDLQKRGLSKAVAQAIALVPPSLGQFARRIPGKAGTALSMSAAIAFNRRRHADLLDNVDRFVVLTAAAEQIVNRNGAPAGKVALNRLGIDRAIPARRRADRTTRPVRVGYVGRFDPIKGVYDLARAVRSLPADTPLRVELRGPAETGDARRVRNEIIQLLDNNPVATFAAPLRPEEVPSHLAALDVLCCPSTCLEGGPTVAIEAHAEGTPVIGTRIGGLAELVTDGVNGRLVPPGDWQALANVLIEIARDPASTVDRWRIALPAPRTMDDVTADYLELYAA
jgi:glycosyltransferase involved in cell wall biosynthesis